MNHSGASSAGLAFDIAYQSRHRSGFCLDERSFVPGFCRCFFFGISRLITAGLFSQILSNGAELFQGGFEVLGDLFGDDVRGGEVR